MSEALKGFAPEMVNYTDDEGFQAAGGWLPNEGIAEYVRADLLAAVEAERDALREAYQDRVQQWMLVCFGEEISADRLERGDRFLEEALELLQSGGYPKERVATLVEYVWGREEGEPSQEVGGVMVTLAAYCQAHGLKMHDAGEAELKRIWTKVEAIRAKQAAKPKGSALPIAKHGGTDV